MNQEQFRPLRRAVIKEELVGITGHYISAIILNQFIYWLDKMRDVDKYIDEESKRNPDVSMPKSSGWIYKSVKELKGEVLIELRDTNFAKYVQALVDLGFVEKRKNPKYEWDKTFQYRVNLLEVHKALSALGYSLDEYQVRIPETGNRIPETGNRIPETGNRIPETGNRIPETGQQYQRLYTENTTENTNPNMNSCSFINNYINTEEKKTPIVPLSNFQVAETAAETSHEVSDCDGGKKLTRKPKNKTSIYDLRKTIKHLDLWTQFWEAYPRHDNERSAIPAWNNALKRYDADELAKIPNAVIQLKANQWFGKDVQYIPMASTFLNQDRWIGIEEQDIVGEVFAKLKKEGKWK